MSCPCTNSKNPGYTSNKYSLPFNVEFSSNSGNNTQTVCNTNMCLLPNGPVLPTRPMFPSALPAEYRPSTTSIDTNYLNVKKVGCICNLRTNCLSVDGGTDKSTNIQFRNLPTKMEGDNVSSLVIDNDGNIYRSIPKPVTKQPLMTTQKVFHDTGNFPPHVNPYESDDSGNITNKYFMNNSQ